MRRFYKLITRVESICDIKNYPDYTRLPEVNTVCVKTSQGLFEFRIKRDNKRDARLFFFKLKKIFTVELKLLSGSADNLDKYQGRVMAVGVYNLHLKFTKKLAYALINKFLTHLTKEDNAISSYINNRKEQV